MPGSLNGKHWDQTLRFDPNFDSLADLEWLCEQASNNDFHDYCKIGFTSGCNNNFIIEGRFQGSETQMAKKSAIPLGDC